MKTMTLFNTVANEVQLSYSSGQSNADLKKITSSKDAYSIFLLIWEEPLELLESFYVLFLNKANKVLGYRCISKGGVTGTVVDPRCIFQAALLVNASAVILAHNHPSGALTTSDADVAITKKITEAGKFLDIAVLDHLIMTSESYFSFADEGLI